MLLVRLPRPARRAERLGPPGGRATRPGWWARAAGRGVVAGVVLGPVAVAVSGRDGEWDRPTRPPATAPHAQETD